MEISQAFDGDEKGLFLIECRLPQVGDLRTEVVFEFVHILRADGRPSEHVGPPLADSFFQHLCTCLC